jgi:cysteine-S-conjugate beta-lyase
MRYDFDHVIERRGTGSLKWDTVERSTGVADALPLWVADMDFKAPDAVLDALRARVEHGIFGYTVKTGSCYRAIIGWMQRRHGWAIERDWILFSPGVVPALNLAVQAYTRPEDRVIVQTPVYYPFSAAVVNNGRELVTNTLIEEGGAYRIDFDGLEQSIDERTRMLIFCSPHNPVGRVWRRDELENLAEICVRNHLVVVSDEIHADLVMKGHTHLPLATISPAVASLTVTCTAPNKTFNVAGLQAGNVIISNPELRDRFRAVLTSAGLTMANILALAASEAAYDHGEEWLEQLLEYLHGNYLFLRTFVEQRMPRVKATPLEGTYLAWLDFRGCGLGDPELKTLLLQKARVWLDAGPMFGPGGEGFQRINIACPRSVLAQALERIAAALD